MMVARTSGTLASHALASPQDQRTATTRTTAISFYPPTFDPYTPPPLVTAPDVYPSFSKQQTVPSFPAFHITQSNTTTEAVAAALPLPALPPVSKLMSDKLCQPPRLVESHSLAHPTHGLACQSLRPYYQTMPAPSPNPQSPQRPSSYYMMSGDIWSDESPSQLSFASPRVIPSLMASANYPATESLVPHAQSTIPSPPTTRTDTGDHASQKVFSFVSLPGVHQRKRPRRKYHEVERLYHCSFEGCDKSYGTLNHLNAHVCMQQHGPKRHPSEFKELRKQWRIKKREQSAESTAKNASASGLDMPGESQHDPATMPESFCGVNPR